MISSTYLMIFGVIIIIVSGIVLWKWWKAPSPSTNMISTHTNDNIEQNKITQGLDKKDGPTNVSPSPPSSSPPPMLFAVNDNGNLDLTDFNNKLLDSSYGSNPKIYLTLLAMATKDVSESATEEGVPTFSSKVGTTKSYEIGSDRYIINYTRLT